MLRLRYRPELENLRLGRRRSEKLPQNASFRDSKKFVVPITWQTPIKMIESAPLGMVPCASGRQGGLQLPADER